MQQNESDDGRRERHDDRPNAADGRERSWSQRSSARNELSIRGRTSWDIVKFTATMSTPE